VVANRSESRWRWSSKRKSEMNEVRSADGAETVKPELLASQRRALCCQYRACQHTRMSVKETLRPPSCSTRGHMTHSHKLVQEVQVRTSRIDHRAYFDASCSSSALNDLDKNRRKNRTACGWTKAPVRILKIRNRVINASTASKCVEKSLRYMLIP
jgi:hypothetical protein